ncbi:hypothetical protein F5I97DRAFT_1807288 [Phlebopus sp. FC_14]|nr:hypothetical protein F5I97DRAFT_1807288 [Phlebopus sp. FC_14]
MLSDFSLLVPKLASPQASPRTLPRLPVELHLQIIETVAGSIPSTPSRDEPYDPNDVATLCACSLVCKLWLHTARAGIWANVHLGNRGRSMALVELLGAYDCECGAHREGDGIQGSRCSRLNIPSFGPHIAHLSIRETRGNPWDPKWLNDALAYLASHLPRIENFEMERVTWEYLSSRSRNACLENFKWAKKLTLRGCTFHTSKEMCDFLAEFDALEVLTLDGVYCSKMNTPRWYLDCWVDGKRAVKSPSRRLREIGLRRAPTEPVLEWIMAGVQRQAPRANSDPGITSFRLGGLGILEADVVGRFLKEVGRSLTKIHVGFQTEFMEMGDAFVSQLDLSRNTNLEEFHIFGLVVPSPPPVDPFEENPEPTLTFTPLTSLLSQIQSPMRVLSLALYPADLRAISTIDFEGLATVFEKAAWSNVEEVRVVISNKGEPGLGEAVRQRLSALGEKGVLRVNVGFDEREVL